MNHTRSYRKCINLPTDFQKTNRTFRKCINFTDHVYLNLHSVSFGRTNRTLKNKSSHSVWIFLRWIFHALSMSYFLEVIRKEKQVVSESNDMKTVSLCIWVVLVLRWFTQIQELQILAQLYFLYTKHVTIINTSYN